MTDYLHAHDVLLAAGQCRGRARRTSQPPRRARSRCRGCGACAGWTRSRHSACAPRSAKRRFDDPTSCTACLGIVNCEARSANRRDTRPARATPRRLGVTTPAAPPRITAQQERRQRDQPPEVINIAWRAQRRLNARWRQLKDARKKPNGIVAVAVARELAGFCWEIATWSPPGPVPPASMPAGDTLTQTRSIPPKQEPAMA